MLGMILPWWVKWAAIAVLVIAASMATGLGVADHYQGKAAKLENKRYEAITNAYIERNKKIIELANLREEANEKYRDNMLVVNSLSGKLWSTKLQLDDSRRVARAAINTINTAQNQASGGGIQADPAELRPRLSCEAAVKTLADWYETLNAEAIKMNAVMATSKKYP